MAEHSTSGIVPWKSQILHLSGHLLIPLSVNSVWKINPLPLPYACVHAKSLQSCPTLWDPMDYSVPGSSVHGDSLDKNTGVGCHFLLQGIFLTQDQTLVSCTAGGFFNRLSYEGSPRMLEWVAVPSSRGSSRPRDQTRGSCIAGRFFTTEPLGKPRSLS